MIEPISVCLIGCGAVSRGFYARALSTPAGRRHFRVDMLVDPSATARTQLLDAFPNARGVASIAEATHCVDRSLAIIATPPRLHLQQALECYARGWHVLCEKPMAGTSAECLSMIEAAESADRLLAVGLYKRFFPSAGLIRQLINDRTLGAALHFSVVEGGPFIWPAASPSFFSKQHTSGGVMLDIGVHVLDLLLWWFDDPQTVDYADDAMGGLEANCRLELGYSSGLRGTVRLSRDWPTANQYRIRFEKGEIAWTVNDANGLTMNIAGLPAALRSQLVDLGPQPVDAALQSNNPQSFTQQLVSIASAIRDKTPVLVDGREGLRSVRLIEDCYARRRLLDQPWMDRAEIEVAQQLAQADRVLA